MIGIGPLVTIPLVVAALGGPLALVGWIAGAIVALCDGLVWAELSVALSRLGRNVRLPAQRLRAAGARARALAFLFNWQFLLAAPCLLASGYIGFANYAAYLYPGTRLQRRRARRGRDRYRRRHDALALSANVASRVDRCGAGRRGNAHGCARRAGRACRTQTLRKSFSSPQPLRFGAGFVAGFGSALYITLYDYAGYAEAALLGDEVVRPERTIPRAIVLSVLIVASALRAAAGRSARRRAVAIAARRARPAHRRRRSTSVRSSSSEPGDASPRSRSRCSSS